MSAVIICLLVLIVVNAFVVVAIREYLSWKRAQYLRFEKALNRIGSDTFYSLVALREIKKLLAQSSTSPNKTAPGVQSEGDTQKDK